MNSFFKITLLFVFIFLFGQDAQAQATTAFQTCESKIQHKEKKKWWGRTHSFKEKQKCRTTRYYDPYRTPPPYRPFFVEPFNNQGFDRQQPCQDWQNGNIDCQQRPFYQQQESWDNWPDDRYGRPGSNRHYTPEEEEGK